MPQVDHTNTPDLVNIEDLDTFVKALVHWHTNRVEMLTHMKGIPSGTEAQDGDGVPIVLEGEVLRAFQLGITTALLELGTLPFTFTMDGEEVPAQEPPAPVLN